MNSEVKITKIKPTYKPPKYVTDNRVKAKKRTVELQSALYKRNNPV